MGRKGTKYALCILSFGLFLKEYQFFGRNDPSE
jgi:hypothetical protein